MSGKNHGGGGGIRTHGPLIGGQRFSRPSRSTTPAPLRGTKICPEKVISASAELCKCIYIGNQITHSLTMNIVLTLKKENVIVSGNADIL